MAPQPAPDAALATLAPKDSAESVALFRAQVLGAVLARGALTRGELAELLRELSSTPFRPPGALVSRTFSVPTLERWIYAWRRGGLAALAPRPRSDRGFAQQLSADQRALILDIRREHPGATASLIVRTLEDDGRLPRGLVSAPTVRRLLRAHGLDRLSLRAGDARGARRRWQAARPGALWHADVCHGPAMRLDGRSLPLRIHAILDDHSRYIVALQACHSEREIDMLALLVKALGDHPAPDALYLDNGSTYSGDVLSTACGRLGIALVHAKPYDPQARGKMERFWRTLRQGCLDHLREPASLHDVQVALLGFLDAHYHRAPHASLLGRSPAQVYEAAAPADPSRRRAHPELRDALTVRTRRRVRRDATLDIAGVTFETDAGFFAGRVVTVARTLVDLTEMPWIEHEGQRLALRLVDPENNAHRPRPPARPRGVDAVVFDPNRARLDTLLRREPRGVR